VTNGELAPVRERRVDGPVPLFVHPAWSVRFPWLIQGTTAGGRAELDLGLFGAAPVGEVLGRWQALRQQLDVTHTVHARQVHQARLLHHKGGSPWLHLADGYDGHLTRTPSVALTVSVADCVPVFLVCPPARACALLHAGWRGAAAGILEAGVRELADLTGVAAADFVVHLGPAICGRCYEVGPEVHRALGLPEPAAPEPVDVRAALARRAVAAGIPAAAVSVSEHCTRCGAGSEASGRAFFSHRAGDRGRQLGVLGIRARNPSNGLT
jgi:polyphenol oxidase